MNDDIRKSIALIEDADNGQSRRQENDVLIQKTFGEYGRYKKYKLKDGGHRYEIWAPLRLLGAGAGTVKVDFDNDQKIERRLLGIGDTFEHAFTKAKANYDRYQKDPAAYYHD